MQIISASHGSLLTIVIQNCDSSRGWRSRINIGWTYEAAKNGFRTLLNCILYSKDRDALYPVHYSSLEGYGLSGKAEVTVLCNNNNDKKKNESTGF